jgi:hypothetical protein
MKTTAVTVTLPTVVLVAAIAGAAGFGIGSATTSTSTAAPAPPAEAHSSSLAADEPAMGETLPPGHPAVDPVAAPTTLVWTPPARWQTVPSTSSMRIATYRIPHAPGDSEDAEMSVTQVGGSVDANIDRWIGQFDATGQKNAKRTHRIIGTFAVSLVEIQGTYSGGMDPGGPKASWALLGAIVETPGMPHFFKMTGPAKTVLAARTELDSMLGTLKN